MVMTLAYLELERDLSACPIAWQNFIKYCQTIEFNAYCGVPAKVLSQELLPYNAEADLENWGAYVEFKSEKDLSWFIMRWS
jgi:hypothetical protein